MDETRRIIESITNKNIFFRLYQSVYKELSSESTPKNTYR